MVRSAGAAGAATAVEGAGVLVDGAGVAVAGATAVCLCGGGAGGTWASNGADVPPRIVPTMSKAPVRRLVVFDFEITRPRLVRKGTTAHFAEKPRLLPCPKRPSQSSAEAAPIAQASPNR